MTMKTHNVWMIGLVLLTAAACHSGTVTKEPPRFKADPVVTMLHEGVIELNGSIEELQRHISELKQMPIDSNPQVQELQALDLASWELHLQQWMVQRDNLVSSLDSIQQAQAAPQDKTAIGDRWFERRAQYLKTIEELRSNRRQIEQKRIDVEAQVLERYFR